MIVSNLHRSVAITAACALLSTIHAQDLGLKAPPQEKTIAIIGATVHPVSGPAIERGFVVFEKGKITDVGPGDPHMPQDWRVINAAGKHVYPGLIGAYTQIGLSEISAVRASEDQREVGQITPEAQAVVSINPDSTLIPVTRTTGVLAAGVFPTGGVISGQPGVVVLDGWTYEEMTVRRSLGVAINWPFPRPVTAWWMKDSKEDQEKRIKESLGLIDESFRKARAYAEARREPNLPTIDIRWEAMSPLFPALSFPPTQPSGTGMLPVPTPSTSLSPQVFILANDVEQIEQAVTWAVELSLRPVILGGRDAPRCADLLKRRNVPVVLMGTHNFPKRDDAPYDEPFTLPAQLESLGVTWCLASGEETAHERSLPHHAGRAVAFGLSHDAAIRAITLSPAKILGVADQLGSLEPGKSATLIITDASPLEITAKVEHAFIHGREIDLSSKQTKLAEKYREKYRQQQSK